VRTLAFAVFGILAAGASCLSAQASGELSPGARIQIERAESTTLSGVYIRRAGDSLLLLDDVIRDTLTIPITSIRELSVSRGRRSAVRRRAWKGLLIGAGIGFALGATVALADDEASDYFSGPLGMGAFTAALLAVPGAVIGALAGISYEVWEPVPLPARGG